MWTKLGDEWPDEAADLTDAAYRLHTEALCWSNRRLYDLLIPKRDLRRFATTEDYDTVITELVETGWWEDRGDSWWLGRKFPEWQMERKQVEHKRARWAETKRRKRLHDIGDHSLCLTKTCRYARMSTEDSSQESRGDPVSVSVSGREVPNYATEEEKHDRQIPA